MSPSSLGLVFDSAISLWSTENEYIFAAYALRLNISSIEIALLHNFTTVWIYLGHFKKL